MKKSMFLAVAIGILSTTQAFAERWECTIIQTSNSGWIPTAVVVQKVGSKYLAADGIVLYSTGKPIKAKRKENNKRILFTWGFTHRNGVGQTARLNYKLSITKSNSKADMRMQPLDFAGNYRGSGSCKETPVDPNFERSIKRAIENG